MNDSSDNESDLFLVTGATGNVGRYIVDQLIEKGQRVRAFTRSPENASLPEEAEIVKGDLTRPETLSAALKGVTGLHLLTISGDSFEPLQTAPKIMELAENARVQKVTVLWSGMEGPVEKAVKASSLGWTILKPQEFMANALEWTESIREEGVVREAFSNRHTAMIHEADIARVATTALTEEDHHAEEYILTGPEVLTPAEAVHIIGDATGQDIHFEELTEKQALEKMHQSGIERESAEFILSWYRDSPPEAYTVVPTVEEVTGRPPRTFRQWAEEHTEKFK